MTGLGSFIFFSVLDSIPSEEGYVIFIGVVNMMAHKNMINVETVTSNACSSEGLNGVNR